LYSCATTRSHSVMPSWTPRWRRLELADKNDAKKSFKRAGSQSSSPSTHKAPKSRIEASSLLGRKWLSVIPFSPVLRLTDFEVSAALHAGTLLPGVALHCRHCGPPNQLGHDEVCLRTAPWTCLRTAPWTVARHEPAKRVIGIARQRMGSRSTSNPSYPAPRAETTSGSSNRLLVYSQAKTSTSPSSPWPLRIPRPPH
jgi:hypothetical protein